MAPYSDTPDDTDHEPAAASPIALDAVLDRYRQASHGGHLVMAGELRTMVAAIDEQDRRQRELVATELRLLADDPDGRVGGVAYISAARLHARADQLHRR